MHGETLKLLFSILVCSRWLRIEFALGERCVLSLPSSRIWCNLILRIMPLF